MKSPVVKPDAADDAITIAPAATSIDTESLTHRTARGFAWMAAQSIATKAMGTVGQIVIAWFLLRDDFGLAAIAYTLSVIPSLIQQGGLKEVLIQRHHQFGRWASPAFWMSMTLGIAGGFVMAAMAPLAARWYDQPQLFGLVVLIALMFPLDSLSTVPMARIYSQMRFRLTATIMLCQAILQTGLTIAFAASGFGPFSLLLPRLIIGVVTAAVYWIAAPVQIKANPEFRLWKRLAGDGALVIGSHGCDLLILYGSYFVLSLVAGPDVVGLYFFAFNLSIQSLVLVTASLSGVLFPALSSLRDQHQRQRQAFLRAVRLLACIAIPVCWLQAAAADPAIRILFPERWHESIALVQLLSIAMALKAIGRPASSMLQAQGRFGVQFALSLFSLTLFGILVFVGATRGSALGVSIAVAIHIAIVEPLILYVALRNKSHPLVDIYSALARPVALAVLVIGPAWLASLAIPQSATYSHWLRLAVVMIVALTLYVPLFMRLTPDAWAEARARVMAFLGRRHQSLQLQTQAP